MPGLFLVSISVQFTSFEYSARIVAATYNTTRTHTANIMETQISYGFNSTTDATRFLNKLKAGAVGRVRARLVRGASAVAVSYTIEDHSGFNGTCSALDELASSLDGTEIHID